MEKTLTYAAKEKKIKIKNQEKLLNPRKQNLIKLRKEEKELMQLFFDEIPKVNNNEKIIYFHPKIKKSKIF